MLHKIYNRALNGFITALEALDTPRKNCPLTPVKHPCIFIIGAPRSGSTLLYQCITEYFDVGYIKNLHRTFYTNIAFAERWIAPLIKKPSSDFLSNLGQTEGPAAPSECAVYWYRFFRRSPQYIPANETDRDSMARLAYSLNRFTRQLNGKPLFVKNMNHALRLPALLEAVPNALFIVTHRDERDTAISILNARKKFHGDYASWWSMEPDRFAEISKLPLEQQASNQIRGIDELINKTRSTMPATRFLDVHHADLLHTPEKVMADIAQFLTGSGVEINRSGKSLPPAFHARKPQLDDTELQEKVERYVNAAN